MCDLHKLVANAYMLATCMCIKLCSYLSCKINFQYEFNRMCSNLIFGSRDNPVLDVDLLYKLVR